MAITGVQVQIGGNSGTNNIPVFPTSVAVGNVLFIRLIWIDPTAMFSSISDGHNTYVIVDNTINDGGSGNHVFCVTAYCVVTTGGSLTVTGTLSSPAASNITMTLIELNGVATLGLIVDGHTGLWQDPSAGPATDAVTSGVITPTQNNDLIIGWTWDVENNDGFTPGTGFTIVAGTSGSRGPLEYITLTNPVPVAATWTLGGGAADFTLSGVIAFVAAGADDIITVSNQWQIGIN